MARLLCDAGPQLDVPDLRPLHLDRVADPARDEHSAKPPPRHRRHRDRSAARGAVRRATAPQWNATQPAIFVSDAGVVYDVQFRHRGSFAFRSVNAKSYKLYFPGYQPYKGERTIFISSKDVKTSEGQTIFRFAGQPVSLTRSVTFYMNSDAPITRLEQGDYSGDSLDGWHKLEQSLAPGSVREETGELYKNQGNVTASQNNAEGPYTRGDLAPMLANAGWTPLQRYEWTYPLQNHDWKGMLPFKQLVEAMWVARGDTNTATNMNVANTRAWFLANWDVESILTNTAILNWMGAWDDVGHNQYFWRRANGKWNVLPWDFDSLMTSTRTSQTIYAGEQGAPAIQFGIGWFKDSLIKAFRAEYNQRLWELNNSLLSPENLTALGLPDAAAFAPGRQTYVNNQLSSFGTYNKPARPTNASPANGTALTLGNLTTSAYSHPTSRPHTSTKWEIRAATGNYQEPLVRTTTTGASLTTFAIPFDQLTYGQTYFWRATHIDADGHPSTISPETSFSWGNPSGTAGTLVLNEILADNKTAAENNGDFPDYIELKNNGTEPLSLEAYGLSDSATNPTKYVFPAGTVIPAGERLIVWCDNATNSPGLHSGFG
jgi:hypothetical protein